MRTSLYVHVPFCVVKCGYCDFNSYAIDDGEVHDRFLAALDAELELAAPPRRPYTVFVGGGTPTHLSEARFERLFEILRRHVDLDRAAEVTVECNPESLTKAKAAIARAAGVRRASVGAQSFDDARLRWLDRAHDAEGTRRAVTALRDAGFENVSLDLIFAVPGQSTTDWDVELDHALALAPEHLSCYSLTFERGTRLGRDLEDGRVTPADESVDAAMFSRTRERLAAAGFTAYEISNFAGRGGPSLHNDHYWLQGDYLGVGPGAATHLSGWRGTNLKVVERWADSIERGLLPTGEAEMLPLRRRLGEAMWLGLRRSAGVDLAALATRLAIDVQAELGELLRGLEAQGFLERDGAAVRLTGRGLLVADAITSQFLGR
ncbi:MAG: radical SAM family heme chaperone HemW [Planctomycetes bacterium]|nr:radical SAM family heme chaperone HemW [Planctomycetota bacterium]